MVAEWSRRLTAHQKVQGLGNSHIDVYNQTYFMNNLKWKKFVKAQIAQWKKFFNWMIDIPEGHTILLIHYEDLKINLTNEMRKILDFVHYKITGI